MPKTRPKAVGGLQEGGRGSVVDVKRSELGLKQAQLQLGNRQRESKLARRQLAAMWGQSEPGSDRVAGKLAAPRESLPSLEDLRVGLEEHPAIAMAKAGKISAEDSLILKRKKVTPDLNVGVAYRRDTTIDDNAVVLKFSLPLPLWNQNEGGIAEAEAAIEQNEAVVAQTLTHLDLDLALSEAWAQLEYAHAEYQIVAGEMLPAAEELHKTLLEGFGLGRTSYLELLEARRSLTEVRSDRINALAKYHTTRVEIETLKLDFSEVQPQAVGATIRATGTIRLDETKVVEIVPRIAGIVDENHQTLGAVVAKGDPLFKLESANSPKSSPPTSMPSNR